MSYEEDLKRARERDRLSALEPKRKSSTLIIGKPLTNEDVAKWRAEKNGSPKPSYNAPKTGKYTEADIYKAMYKDSILGRDNVKARNVLNNNGFLRGTENLFKGTDPVTNVMESVDNAGRIAHAAVQDARKKLGMKPLGAYESYDPLVRRQKARNEARQEFKKQVGNDVVGDIALSGMDMLSNMGTAAMFGAGKGAAAVGKQLLKPKNLMRSLPGGTFSEGFVNYLAAQGALETAAEDLEKGRSFGKSLTHGIGSGLISKATESLGGIGQTPAGKAFVEKIGSNPLIKKVTDRLSEDAKKYLSGKIGSFALSMAKEAGGEGFEELIEYPAQYWLNRIINDDKTPYDIKENLYNAVIGAGVGGVFGFPGAVADGINAGKKSEAVSRETDIKEEAFEEQKEDFAENVQKEAPKPKKEEWQGPLQPLGLPEHAVLIADDRGNVGTKAYMDSHDLSSYEPTNPGKIDITAQDVRNEAAKVFDNYPIKIKGKEIESDLHDLYQFMADNTLDERGYDKAREKALKIAEKVVNSSEIVDDSLYFQHEDLRDYIKNAKFEISEKDASNFPDYNEWRKKRFGKFNIKKGKTNIDKIYRELAEMFPAFFDTETEITPADQLEKIADVMETVYDKTAYNPFEGKIDETVNALADELLTDFFSVSPVKSAVGKANARPKEYKKIIENNPSAYGQKGVFVESKAGENIKRPQKLKNLKAETEAETKTAETVNYTENAEVNELIERMHRLKEKDANNIRNKAKTVKNDAFANENVSPSIENETVSRETEAEKVNNEPKNEYVPRAVKNKNAGLRYNKETLKYTARSKRIIDGIAKKAGVEVIFDSNMGTKNGEYDSETGTIRISTEAENPIGVVLNHEITHRLKETDPHGFEKIKKLALEQIKSEGSYEDVYNELKRFYPEKDIDEEIVCDMMGRFAKDPKTFEKLCNIDRNLAQKIFDWFDAFWREGFWNEDKNHLNDLGHYTEGETMLIREAWEGALKRTQYTHYNLSEGLKNSYKNDGVKSSFKLHPDEIKRDIKDKAQEARVKTEEFFTPHEPLEGERRDARGFNINDLGSENAFKGINELFDASFEDAIEIDFGEPEEGATANILAHKPKKADTNFSDEWDYVKRKIFDSAATIVKIGEEVEDRSLFNLFNNATQARQQAENAIGRAQTDLKGDKIGDSLNDVFKEARKGGDDYFNAFQEYLYHHLNIDRMTAATEGRKKIQEEINSLFLSNPELMKLSDEQLLRKSHGKSERGTRAKAILNKMAEKSGKGKDQKTAIDSEIELILNEDPSLRGKNKTQLLEISTERSADALTAAKIINLRNRMGKIQNKPVFGKNMTAQRSAMVLRGLDENHPEFKKMAEKVWKYNDNLLQIRQDAGLISKTDREFFKELYPHYVPAFVDAGNNAAAFEYSKGSRVSKTIKRAKGNYGYDLLPIDISMASQTSQVYKNARTNIFGLKLADIALKNKDKIGHYVQGAYDTIADFDIDDPTNLDSAFLVYAGGKPIELRVSPGVMEAVNTLMPKKQENSKVWKAILKGNNTYKALITGYSPYFAARNGLKDPQDAALFSRDTEAFAKNLPKALKTIREVEGGKTPKDKHLAKLWEIYNGMGGTGTSYFDYEKGIDYNLKDKFNLMDKIEKINSNIEQGPRFAEFVTIIDSVHKGDTSFENLADAMEGAADITVNFGRGGTWTKMLNRNFVPFLNPSVQGTYKLGREISGKGALGADVKGKRAKQVKALKTLAIRAAAVGILPGVLQYLLYKDLEGYKELPDRVKDENYLILKPDGTFWKLPMGRILSIANAGARRTLEGNFEGYGGHISEQVVPASPFRNHIVSQVINTDLFDEKSPGKTWYNGDIVPAELMGRPVEEQFDERTDKLSVFLGKHLHLSPKKINNLLESYTGVIGEVLIPMMTPAAEKLVFTSQFVADPVTQSKIPSEFWGKYDELSKNKNSSHPDKDIDVVMRYMSHVRSESGKLSDKIREVQGGDGKRGKKLQEVREIRTIQNALQKEALANLDSFRKEASANLKDAQQMPWLEKPEEKVDYAYRVTNRKLFGAEYALKNYNKRTYENALKAKEEGQSFEEYYDIYFKNYEYDKKKEWEKKQKGIKPKEKSKKVKLKNLSLYN